MTVSFSVSCNKECGGALVDLTTSLIPSVVGTVLAGVPFNIDAVIENAIPTLTACTGRTAGSSTSNYKINYGEQEGNFTSNEEDANYLIGSIASGNSITESFETLFTQPGFYELITITDFGNVVDEENENNNTFNTQTEFRAESTSDFDRGNPQSRLVFEVVANPDFTPERGMPRVFFTRK